MCVCVCVCVCWGGGVLEFTFDHFFSFHSITKNGRQFYTGATASLQYLFFLKETVTRKIIDCACQFFTGSNHTQLT